MRLTRAVCQRNKETKNSNPTSPDGLMGARLVGVPLDSAPEEWIFFCVQQQVLNLDGLPSELCWDESKSPSAWLLRSAEQMRRTVASAPPGATAAATVASAPPTTAPTTADTSWSAKFRSPRQIFLPFHFG